MGDTCIIGAGPAGLAAARALKARGLPYTHLERHTAVGGLWDIDNPGTPLYESAHFISSRTMSAFSGHPMPDDYPDYPEPPADPRLPEGVCRRLRPHRQHRVRSRSHRDRAHRRRRLAGPPLRRHRHRARSGGGGVRRPVGPDRARPARRLHRRGAAFGHLPQRRGADGTPGAGRRRRQLRLRHRLRRRPQRRPRRAQRPPRLLVHSQARVRHPLRRVRRERPHPADVAGAETVRSAAAAAGGRPDPARPAQTRPQAVRDPSDPEQPADPPPAARRHHRPAGDRRRPRHHDHLHRRQHRGRRPGAARHRLPAAPPLRGRRARRHPELYLTAFAPQPGLYGIGYVETNAAAYPSMDVLAHMVAAHIADRTERPDAWAAFEQRIRTDHPDLTGGIRFVNSPRHRGYVNATSFLAYLHKVAAEQGWQVP